MAFPAESQAFAAFQRTFPKHAVLLIDTYDTLRGARRATRLGHGIKGVRLDSGDLASQSRQVRKILDDAGMPEAIIVASGDLNEDSIARLNAEGAPIDLYGVGTDLVTSRDAPALGGVYKLVAVDHDDYHRPVRKLSQDKSTYPDVKQLYRTLDADGKIAGDTLALATETLPGEPLLVPVLRSGELVQPLPSLPEIRDRARAQRDTLPEAVRRLRDPETLKPSISPGIQGVIRDLEGKL
jgi:nicotinate phosphoribosyltransferase